MTTTPSTPPSVPPARPVLTFRTPEDVLAAVPVLLGFEPSDSVVMLTFGGRETFLRAEEVFELDFAHPD